MTVSKNFCFLLTLLFIFSCNRKEAGEVQAAFTIPEAAQLQKIGSIAAFGDDGFFAQPTQLILLPDQHFVVADRQQVTLYHFNKEFKLVEVIGREGQGPGEFGQFSDLRFFNDTLSVYDGRNQRVSRYHYAEGIFSLAGSESFKYAAIKNHPAARFDAFLPGSSGTNMALYIDFNMMSQAEIRQTKIVGISYDNAFQPAADTALVVLDYIPEVHYQNGILSVPFLHRGFYGTTSKYMVYAANDKPVVQFYNYLGKLSHELEIPASETELSVEEKEQVFEERYRNAENPERFRQPVLSLMPDKRPFIRSLKTDIEDRIWVQVYTDSTRADWMLFDEQGDISAAVDMPDGMIFMNAGNGRVYLRNQSAEGPEIVIFSME